MLKFIKVEEMQKSEISQYLKVKYLYLKQTCLQNFFENVVKVYDFCP